MGELGCSRSMGAKLIEVKREGTIPEGNAHQDMQVLSASTIVWHVDQSL